MRISMDLELKDTPGQLMHVLTPISDLGGNITSVVHHHDKKTFRNTVPVSVILEIDEQTLGELQDGLEQNGVTIVRVGKMRLRATTHILLIGHIIHTDLRDTIDEIDATGFAEVQDLSLSMPAIDGPSSAVITIMATGDKELKTSIGILRQIAERKDLLIIEPLDERGSPGGTSNGE
ncbi:MAG: amino acid-binding protein [Halobacteriota archaeon]|jgi:ACT domain-containing protein